MGRLQEVKRKLEELRLEEMRLEAENFHEHLKDKIVKSIGKTFAFRNNSCGGEERWDAFRKLKGVEFGKYHAWAVYETCQLRADTGIPELELSVDLISRDGTFPKTDDGWEPCETVEFEECKRLCLRELENPIMALRHCAQR